MSETMLTTESFFNNTPTNMSQFLLRSLTLPNAENLSMTKSDLSGSADLQNKLNDIKTSIFNIQAEDLWTILDDTNILKTKLGELKLYEE